MPSSEEIEAPEILAQSKAATDDGYGSSIESLTEELSKVSVSKQVEAESKEDTPKDDEEEDDDDDEEKILQPLQIIDICIKTSDIKLTPKGPIPIDSEEKRYQPYIRRANVQNNALNGIPQLPSSSIPGAENIFNGVEQIATTSDENINRYRSSPKVLILTKSDNLIQLGIKIRWSNQHEITMDRCQLPEETYFGVDSPPGTLIMFLQVNPHTQELKKFNADVKNGTDDHEINKKFIGPIVISLKIPLDDSVEKKLLSKIAPSQKEEAEHLVGAKTISQLTAGIGPHKDTVLAVLSAQKQMNGQTLAQIYAVTKRLISHQDYQVKNTIFKHNSNQISAFEIAAITNNHMVATYLAEVMYNLIDDTNEATTTLNSRDTQGNTIIHLLARKGDQNTDTLNALLMMKLRDGSQLFQVNVPNTKKQLPIHIATQNSKNQPATIALLYQVMPQSLEARDDDGMSPLHYACQRTSDVALIETILSYKKDNINKPRKDNLTALDLITNRTQALTPGQVSFPIDQVNKDMIIQCLRNNGAKSGIFPVADSGIFTPVAEIPPQPSPEYQQEYQFHPQQNQIAQNKQQVPIQVIDNSPILESPSASPSYSMPSYTTSPRTPSIMSPGGQSYMSNDHTCQNSQGEASPWSSRSSPAQYTNFQDHYSPQMHSPSTTHSPDSPPYNPDSPVQEQPSDFEEEGARIIYQQFPGIQNLIALLDENQ